MRWIAVFVWFGNQGLVHGALTALPPYQNWTPGSRETLAGELARSQDIQGAADELKSWLIGNYQPSSIAVKPPWGEVLGLYKWQKLRGEVGDVPDATWNLLMSDPALTGEFFQNQSPLDNAGHVVRILDELHQAAPDKFPAYGSLALAFALVWDNPPPLKINSQVGQGSVPQDASTVAERFIFYVAANEKNDLEWDLRKLPAEHLKFIVDSAVSLDELRWAQKNVRTPKGSYDAVFASIKYDSRRLESGVYDWPFPEYSLEEIRKRGGLCVDQAYFAALTGKAKGIPTLYFHGSGRRGGHAWFGYLKGKDKWDLDCGRYAYDKYATGSARDPQTGEIITDHELDYLSKSFRRSAAYRSAQLIADAARLMAEAGDRNAALSAVDDALKVENRDYAVWLLKEYLLKEDGRSTELEALYKAMGQRFANYPDLRVQIQAKMMALHESLGKTNEVKKIKQSIISRNSNERSDLSLGIIEEAIQSKCAANDYPGALKEFKSALRKFADETGPVLNLLQKFVETCLAAHEVKTAAEAARSFKGKVALDANLKTEFDGIEQRIRQSGAKTSRDSSR